jgi:hypothetical protein
MSTGIAKASLHRRSPTDGQETRYHRKVQVTSRETLRIFQETHPSSIPELACRRMSLAFFLGLGYVAGRRQVNRFFCRGVSIQLSGGLTLSLRGR